MCERIILLNSECYPMKFEDINVNPPNQSSKIEYVENSIITAMNKYNPKLSITRLEYLNIQEQFPQCKGQQSNGLLIEEFEINEANQERYSRGGCYITTDGNQIICRRIILYLFVSNPTESSRTAFVSQTVFPSLIEYANDYISSPSYSIANHKFCFINIVNSHMTANMILRHLVGLCCAGIDYVEVFNNKTLNVADIPTNLKDIIEKYDSKFATNYNNHTEIYKNDYYEIDFKQKIFRWRVVYILKNIVINTANRIGFQGSSEKFYWIEVLPMALYAYKKGFRIDYNEYAKFIADYIGIFDDENTKFRRFRVLLAYIEKFFI